VLPKWAWSGSCEQFLHCGLTQFRHSKSSVYRWYTQLDRRRFVYDTLDNGSRLGRVMVECTLSITHCLRLNLQLHTIDLVRTSRISSFCTIAWQLARFQLTQRIARSLGDSWASCIQRCALSVMNWGRSLTTLATIDVSWKWVMSTEDVCYHTTFLSAVVAVVVCPSVCPSQTGILSKRLDDLSLFLARRLPSTYLTLCYNEI